MLISYVFIFQYRLSDIQGTGYFIFPSLRMVQKYVVTLAFLSLKDMLLSSSIKFW